MNQKLRNMLMRHEGLRLKAYKCTGGKTSIGYGRNLDDVGITDMEAIYLFSNDIARITSALSRMRWFTLLNDVRQAVMINMAFNLGVMGLLNFKKMIFFIDLGKFDQAAVEMLNSKWAKQVGDRAVELAKLMESGMAEPN